MLGPLYLHSHLPNLEAHVISCFPYPIMPDLFWTRIGGTAYPAAFIPVFFYLPKILPPDLHDRFAILDLVWSLVRWAAFLAELLSVCI